MKKTLILLLVAAFCTLQMNAQTPCEKTFEKAKNYYVSKDYANAKAQFQKVVNNCDSNKELAQGYIQLCDEFISLADKQKKANNVDNSALVQENNNLKNRISQLEKDKAELQKQILTDKEKLEEKVQSITQLESEKEALLTKQKDDGSLVEQLRDLGNEMNVCLKSYCRNRNKPFYSYDKLNDANGIIEAMSKNIKNASKKSKK